jgi:hypothetical protein
MKKTQTATRLPVSNQTQAKSHGTIAGSQSQTSESHGKQTIGRSSTGFLPFTFSLLPFLLLTVLWISCDNPSSSQTADIEPVEITLTVDGTAGGLAGAFETVNADAKDRRYTVIVPAGEYTIEPVTLKTAAGTAKTVVLQAAAGATLEAAPAAPAVALKADGDKSLFTVDSGVTLKVGTGFTLSGPECTGSLAVIRERGALVLEDGAAITGSESGYAVQDGGTLILGGGAEITGKIYLAEGKKITVGDGWEPPEEDGLVIAAADWEDWEEGYSPFVNAAGAPVEVSVTYEQANEDNGADIAVTFSSLAADGAAQTDTTKLTLTFSADIEGLDENDIILTPSGGSVQTGELKKTGTGVYELEVKSVSLSGATVSVTVAEIDGYDITGDPAAVTVYATYIVIPDKTTFAKIGVDTTNYPLDGNYRQIADIDMSGGNWTPIGTSSSSTFAGTFDGGGYQTTNLTINVSTTEAGLFGYISGATLKNINIASGSVTNIGGYAGGICGVANTNASNIIDCYNNATISSSSAAGGICGNSLKGTITGCRNTASVTGKSNVGGIVGSALGSANLTISACYNTGDITNVEYTTTNVGGIAGTASCAVTACYNAGKVEGTATTTLSVGGISGFSLSDTGTLTACYNEGEVEGKLVGTVNSNKYYAGGVVGQHNKTSTIKACYNIGKVSATVTSTGAAGVRYAGGVAGFISVAGAATIACYWKDIDGDNASSGIGFIKDGAATDDNAVKFASGVWPATNTHTEWGTGDGSGSGKYWKSLGEWNSGSPTYPKLWFEN